MSKKVWSFVPVLSLGAALALAAMPSGASAAIIADSVADFSTSQGTNNWYYMGQTTAITPANVNDATLMSLNGGQFDIVPNTTPHWRTNTAGATYTALWDDGAHPGLAGERSIRRWVSEVTGLVDITGSVGRTFQGAFGNGVSIGVFVDGTLQGSYINVPGNTTSPINLPSVSVTAGALVDFVLSDSPNGAMTGDLNSDVTDFSVQISEVPEPASLGLLAGGAVLMFARRRRA